MSEFGAANVDGSAPPSRVASPTPSQKERNIIKEAADAEQKAVDFQAAREAGWVDTTDVDYTHQNAAGEWYGSGGKYEWLDDYGDVAPDIPELEMILFGSEHQVRSGEHMEALDAEVRVEGPFAVKPVNNVSNISPRPATLTCLYTLTQLLTMSSSTTPAFIQSCLRMSSDAATRFPLPFKPTPSRRFCLDTTWSPLL